MRRFRSRQASFDVKTLFVRQTWLRNRLPWFFAHMLWLACRLWRRPDSWLIQKIQVRFFHCVQIGNDLRSRRHRSHARVENFVIDAKAVALFQIRSRGCGGSFRRNHCGIVHGSIPQFAPFDMSTIFRRFLSRRSLFEKLIKLREIRHIGYARRKCRRAGRCR